VSSGRRAGDPRADRVRERHDAAFGTPGPPVPVEAIAEDLLGLRLGEAELRVSGMLIPARREIWVDAAEARESPARRRFTIAHEIGHWVCQVRAGRGAPVHCRPDPAAGSAAPGDPREREANVFAAELLMPEAPLRRAVAEGAGAPELERLFAVSPPAMAWRLYNLGIADGPPAAG
jgi:hypothetical protein